MNANLKNAIETKRQNNEDIENATRELRALVDKELNGETIDRFYKSHLKQVVVGLYENAQWLENKIDAYDY